RGRWSSAQLSFVGCGATERGVTDPVVSEAFVGGVVGGDPLVPSEGFDGGFVDLAGCPVCGAGGDRCGAEHHTAQMVGVREGAGVGVLAARGMTHVMYSPNPPSVRAAASSSVISWTWP